jgi:hypothetical protein
MKKNLEIKVRITNDEIVIATEEQNKDKHAFMERLRERLKIKGCKEIQCGYEDMLKTL